LLIDQQYLISFREKYDKSGNMEEIIRNETIYLNCR
jgi:hypothetical protein